MRTSSLPIDLAIYPNYGTICRNHKNYDNNYYVMITQFTFLILISTNYNYLRKVRKFA